jgi:hypothetical protein
MRKPKFYKGLSYSFPEAGLMAIYTPNDELVGEKLYVLKQTPQTQPIAYVLKRLIDEATRLKWYERVWHHFRPQKPSVDIIAEKLGTTIESPIEKNGRVVKVKGAAEYDPSQKTGGGRVVRGMPKQLRKIKEGQEAPSDEV